MNHAAIVALAFPLAISMTCVARSEPTRLFDLPPPESLGWKAPTETKRIAPPDTGTKRRAVVTQGDIGEPVDEGREAKPAYVAVMVDIKQCQERVLRHHRDEADLQNKLLLCDQLRGGAKIVPVACADDAEKQSTSLSGMGHRPIAACFQRYPMIYPDR